MLLLLLLLLVTLYELTAERPPACQVILDQPKPLALCIKVTQRLLQWRAAETARQWEQQTNHPSRFICLTQ
jgi:hypothetical protein